MNCKNLNGPEVKDGVGAGSCSRTVDGLVILTAHPDQAFLNRTCIKLEASGAGVVMAPSATDALSSLSRFAFSAALIHPSFLKPHNNALLLKLLNLRLPFAYWEPEQPLTHGAILTWTTDPEPAFGAAIMELIKRDS